MMPIRKLDFASAFVFAVWLHGATGWQHDFNLPGALLIGFWLAYVGRVALTHALRLIRWLLRLPGARQVAVEPARRLSGQEAREAPRLARYGRRHIGGARGIVLR